MANPTGTNSLAQRERVKVWSIDIDPVTVTDAATYTVRAADTGKIHIMPDFTASCTLTLPTAEAGLVYEFVSKAVAADAHNWVFNTSGSAPYKGGVQFLDTDEPAGAVLTSVFSDGTDTILTVTTPGAGTYVKLICDGTNWVAIGIVASATAPAFS
jgi:hypothetical protein